MVLHGAADNLDNLPPGFAVTKDRLRHPTAQPAVRIEPGKPQIVKREAPQFLDECLWWARSPAHLPNPPPETLLSDHQPDTTR